MDEEVKDAVVRVETRTIREKLTEADHKFILAFGMIIAYAIMLAIPILTSNKDILEVVTSTMSGPVGTVIGYYFGTKKT
ncbi:MAG: hypothetical protein OEZ24_04150 [Candidatus Bathyarchaeota archaeon]|nr:hypothetical protein [Candidatus Bathyarchaeota archaeon]